MTLTFRLTESLHGWMRILEPLNFDTRWGEDLRICGFYGETSGECDFKKIKVARWSASNSASKWSRILIRTSNWFRYQNRQIQFADSALKNVRSFLIVSFRRFWCAVIESRNFSITWYDCWRKWRWNDDDVSPVEVRNIAARYRERKEGSEKLITQISSVIPLVLPFRPHSPEKLFEKSRPGLFGHWTVRE